MRGLSSTGSSDAHDADTESEETVRKRALTVHDDHMTGRGPVSRSRQNF